MTARRIATMKPTSYRPHHVSSKPFISAAMLSAVDEADLICAGKVSAVAYDSFDDLLADIDAEIERI